MGSSAGLLVPGSGLKDPSARRDSACSTKKETTPLRELNCSEDSDNADSVTSAGKPNGRWFSAARRDSGAKCNWPKSSEKFLLMRKTPPRRTHSLNAGLIATADVAVNSIDVEGCETVLLEDVHDDECSSGRRDEGLGESFDINSEVSDTNSRTGTLVDLQSVSPSLHHQKPHRPNHRNKVQPASPQNNHQRKCKQSANRRPSLALRHNSVADDEAEENCEDGDKLNIGLGISDDESSGGIDPLTFLSDTSDKRVTFM